MSKDDPAPGTGASYEPEQPQTKTEEQPAPETQNIPAPTPDSSIAGNIILTQEQFDTLVKRLGGRSTQVDHQPSPSLSPNPGSGLQVNPFGAVVGTVTKFNINPEYYPDPRERLYDEPRLSRFSMRENYFITWDISAKPYQTKDNMSIQEPTFHVTLYQNLFDDQGKETGSAIVIQTLHMNEDEELCRMFAAENGFEVTDESLKQLMDDTRYARISNWLLSIFFPPRNFEMSVDSHEEAIGGSVVKVVTKSNVKGFGNPTPKIDDEELQ